MKVTKFDGRESWLAARRGRITGSRLKDIYTKRADTRKIGFYELIAERLALPPDGENPMDRGNRLEEEAIERFAKETGKKVNTDLVIWSRDDSDAIAVSPDGVIGKTEAVEAKCLSSARHIEAFLTQEIPEEYKHQRLQYFIVNESLKALHFVFYDPRLYTTPYFVLTTKREDVEAEITEYLAFQRDILTEVDEIVNRLSNF